VYQVAAFAPDPDRAKLAGALGTTSAAYAALGVGTVCGAMINLDEFLAYQEARDRNLLNVRVRPMIRVGSELAADQAIALVAGLGARSGFGDDWLRIWGLKFVMDGGVEGAAMEQPYANDPGNSGHLNWEPSAMIKVCTEAVRGGFSVTVQHPVCGTWPARCWWPGDPSAPGKPSRSTSGWPPTRTWPRAPISCGR
jgi:predicted amidohydrolase YtcJ